MMFGNDHVSLGNMFMTTTGSARKIYVVQALVEQPTCPTPPFGWPR